MGEEALKYDEVIVELQGLKKKEIREVIDFIGYLKTKKKKRKSPYKAKEEGIVAVIGTMKGPPDLAENHDHYLYGCEKEH